MNNTNEGNETHNPIENPSWYRRIRLVRYVKAKMDERASKKAKETASDKSARVTANATKWMAVFTFLLFASSMATYYVLHRQLGEMGQATKATQEAAYAACVNAQISQRQLLEIQRTNSFSQTMAVSSTTQAAAEINTERAYINFIPRLPRPEENFPSDPNFEVVYTIKNDGKSAAKDGSIGIKAILVGNDEVLKFPDKGIPESLHANYFPAGGSFPSIPEVGRPVTLSVPVVDNNGNSVAKSSEKVHKISTASAIVAVIGFIKYSDFAGSHKARFCASLWEMQPGTERSGSSANEKACAKYNRQIDDYASAAKPPLAGPQEPLTSITCPTPRN